MIAFVTSLTMPETVEVTKLVISAVVYSNNHPLLNGKGTLPIEMPVELDLL